MREWFKARNTWGGAFLALSDAEAGRLAKALWTYTMTGKQPKLSGAEKATFAMFQITLDQDTERESDISSKRAIAGSAGGKQRVANQAIATFAKQNEQAEANANNKNQNQKKTRFKKKEYLKSITGYIRLVKRARSGTTAKRTLAFVFLLKG